MTVCFQVDSLLLVVHSFHFNTLREKSNTVTQLPMVVEGRDSVDN
jgi:hypothetical protein